MTTYILKVPEIFFLIPLKGTDLDLWVCTMPVFGIDAQLVIL